MTITDLVNETRADFLNDSVAPYLWSDAQLTRYANEAIQEACGRAPLIIRVKTVSVLPGTADYIIDSYTKQIQVAKLSLATSPLQPATDADLSTRIGYSWRTRNGTPIGYVRRGHKITLYPNPIVADTLVITASSLPDGDFDIEDDIDPAYHKSLIFYMVYKALMLNDADTYNPVKAADFLKMFDAKFGIQHTAKYNSVSYDTPMYSTVSPGRMC